MVAALLWLARPVDWWIAAAVMERIAWLAGSVVAGGSAYFIALVVMGLRPVQFRMRHD
jgi:peptidoglycan biosynthesis protein MviN/MurJ (putative lipid II flippase)